MIYLPILGALALASGTLLEKIVLKKRKIGTYLYTTAIFLSTTLVMLPFIHWLWKTQPGWNSFYVLGIFSLIILLSILANLFLFYSLKWEKLNNIEPALILEPLFVIVMAIVFSFFLPKLYERNFVVIIPAIIAALALVFSHIKKHHLNFNKYFLAAIAGSFFFALELVLSRLILDYFSPFTFYFIRCASIALFALVFFRPKLSRINDKMDFLIVLTGATWVFYRLVVYWGYLELGVVFTTLMVMLGPVFVYAMAKIFLKEKLNWRNIFASIVIICCVLYVVLM